MNNAEANSWSPKIAQELYQVLKKKYPPISSSPLLQDLVTALTNSLENGDLYIDLSDKLQPNGIKEAGWPEAHRKVLLESGWLNDNSSPIIHTGSQLSWRRWHSDMDDLIQNLLKNCKQLMIVDKQL